MAAKGDEILYAVECSLLSIAVVAWVLRWMLRRLRRSRPGLDLWKPLLVGGVLRLVVIVMLAANGSLAALRGPDDRNFGAAAGILAKGPLFSHDWLSTSAGQLHVTLAALQFRLLDTTEVFSVRIVQVGLALVGICLLAAAAYDLAAARVARWVAWFAAVEPAGVFFSSFVHKEPEMMLAEGMVAFGAVRVWRLRDRAGFLFMAGGVTIGGLTRPYGGAALGAAALIVTLHAALRPIGRSRARSRRMALASSAVLLVAIGALGAQSGRVVDYLQTSQSANTSDASNLKLEPVDFSSPARIAVNTPRRIRDLLLRPYPWQLANNSQRLAAVGTLVAWVMLALILVTLVRDRSRALGRAPPLAYLAVCVTVGYALSVGNAGTGFRYRTHVLLILAALLGALWAGTREAPATREA